MYLLDTNVLSAMMHAHRVPEIASWIARQPSDVLFTASLCQAEILSGIAILPEGRRRTALDHAATVIFSEDFDGRVLPFDSAAAFAYAILFAAHRQAGRTIAGVDLMIAAVAQVRGATVVSRNVKDFEGCGIDLVNPWTSGP